MSKITNEQLNALLEQNRLLMDKIAQITTNVPTTKLPPSKKEDAPKLEYRLALEVVPAQGKYPEMLRLYYALPNGDNAFLYGKNAIIQGGKMKWRDIKRALSTSDLSKIIDNFIK